ncbi:MAG: type II toxin-antitoxin system RelE/ParE family toxin [Patescibacteria group bacterium]
MLSEDLRKDLLWYLKKRNLLKKFEKQLSLLKNNPKHPSLNTEILEPRQLRIYSFRIDKKYRAIFVIRNGKIEIVDINDHYR